MATAVPEDHGASPGFTNINGAAAPTPVRSGQAIKEPAPDSIIALFLPKSFYSLSLSQSFSQSLSSIKSLNNSVWMLLRRCSFLIFQALELPFLSGFTVEHAEDFLNNII